MDQAELTAGFLLWREPPLGWSLIKEQEEPGSHVTLKKDDSRDLKKPHTNLSPYHMKSLIPITQR